MTEIESLRRRVGELEQRLEVYHLNLEQSLNHDREFQLKASWNIVNSSMGAIALIGVLYATQQLVKIDHWIWEGLRWILAVAAFVFISSWSDKGRMDDLKKLSRLPKWNKSNDA